MPIASAVILNAMGRDELYIDWVKRRPDIIDAMP